MRFLILGGDGMLGHQLLKSWQERHEVKVTLRDPLRSYAQYGLFHEGNALGGVDVGQLDRILEVVGQFCPEIIVNCTGIVKQRSAAKDHIQSLEINSLLPHRLRNICAAARARLVHLSTDCVFNGRRGFYRETDHADAEDLYGLSKYLGEVTESPAITLRAPFIGLELGRKQGLIEWFLEQKGTMRGFTRAIYSGVTTIEMARIIEHVVLHQPDMHGLWHVSSDPINKFDLLSRLSSKLGRNDIQIVSDDSFVCDRSLDSSEFKRRTGYQIPNWNRMLDELADQVRERGG